MAEVEVKRAVFHVIAIAALAAIAAGGVLLWRQRPWRTAVSVNGRILTARELDMRAQLLLEDGRRMGMINVTLEDFRRQAAARWIVKEVLLAEAVDRGIELGADDEKDELVKLERDLKSHNLTIDQYFRHMPLPEEMMRRDFREVLLLRKYLKKEVDDTISLSSDEIDASMRTLRAKLLMHKELGGKPNFKTDRKSVTDMLRASRMNDAYRELLRTLCEKADVRVPEYPFLQDFERYVLPWSPRSRQTPQPQGVAPERKKK